MQEERHSVELSEITPDNSFDQLRREALNTIDAIEDGDLIDTPELVTRCSAVVLNLLGRQDLSSEQTAQVGEYANVLCLQERLASARGLIASGERMDLVERRILTKYLRSMESTLQKIDRLIPEVRETLYDGDSTRIVSPLAIRITNQRELGQVSRKDHQSQLIKEVFYGNGKERELDTITRLTWLAQHDNYFQPWTKEFRVLAESSSDRAGTLSEPEFPQNFDIYDDFFIQENDFSTNEDWGILDEQVTDPIRFTEGWAAMLENERMRTSDNKRKLDQEVATEALNKSARLDEPVDIEEILSQSDHEASAILPSQDTSLEVVTGFRSVMKLPKEQSIFILSDNVASAGPTHIPREAEYIKTIRELSRSAREHDKLTGNSMASRFSLITKELSGATNHAVPNPNFKFEVSEDAYHHFMLQSRKYASSWEDDMQLYLGYNPVSDEYFWPPIEHIYDNSGLVSKSKPAFCFKAFPRCHPDNKVLPRNVPDVSVQKTALPFEIKGEILFEGFVMCIWKNQEMVASELEKRLEHALVRLVQGQNDDGSTFYQIIAVGGKAYKRFWANLNPLSLKINGKMSQTTRIKMNEADPERSVGVTVNLDGLEGANYQLVFWNYMDAEKFVEVAVNSVDDLGSDRMICSV